MAPAPSELQRLSDRYAAFASDEARGSSAIYEKLALGVAATPELLSLSPACRRIAGNPICSSRPSVICTGFPKTRIVS